MKPLNKYILPGLLLALAGWSMGACTDDLNVPDGVVDVEPGRPACITLKVALPEMSVMSRAAMSEAEAYTVNNLWIATFSNSGAMTSKNDDGEFAPTIIESPSMDKYTWENHTQPVSVTLNTLSGESHIVAVANIDRNRARYKDGSTASLRDQLAKVKTWSDFQSIAVLLPSSGSVDMPIDNNLPMSGVYLEDDHAANTTDWEKLSNELVTIPESSQTLKGQIHLRRLISHITFNISLQSSDGRSNVESFEPVSFKVFNVPNSSWLHERTRTGGKTLNSGDEYISLQFPDRTEVNSHVDSDIFTKDYFDKSGGDGNTAYSFDFYQMENKRTGSDDITTYNDREAHESGDARAFTNLTGRDAYATYVEIKGKLKLVNHNKPEDLVDNSISFVDVTSREADVTYVVHLGYCEGSDPGKSRDFNSRRNTTYTYNMRIVDVNRIIVEAIDDNEVQPGNEGLVFDVTAKAIEMDAHYESTNVWFTPEELANFSYYISAWYDNDQELHEIDSNDASSIPNSTDYENYKFYNWVTFIPINSPDTRAVYEPAKLLHVGDLLNYTPRDGHTQVEGKYYFTCFVNEHTYEPGDNDPTASGWGDEETGQAWKKYVNVKPRRVMLYTSNESSPDNNSRYYKAKFSISQKSIQTYYDPAKSNNAVGIEHINETFGLNLRQSFFGEADAEHPHANSNGRYNVLRYIGDNKDWNSYMNRTVYQSINAITDQGLNIPAHSVGLPELVSYSGASVGNGDLDRQGDAKFIEAINACMSRNRDLNGDGHIDNQELRWYVPASGKYLRMILGRNSLETPIMDYVSVGGKLPNPGSGNNTRFIMYASNGKVIWAHEGLSTSSWAKATAGNGPTPESGAGYPTQVRCIRNLGTNLAQINELDQVDMAYDVDDGRDVGNNMRIYTVTMSRYNSKSIRESRVEPLPIHNVTDQAYNRCAYQFEIAPYTISLTNNNASKDIEEWKDAILNEKLCDQLNDLSAAENYGGGWRLPNQKELSIINNSGKVLDIEHASVDEHVYLFSTTFSYFDIGGHAWNANAALSPVDYFVMGLRGNGSNSDSSRGDNTQVNNASVNTTSGSWNRSIGIRCVRDVQR